MHEHSLAISVCLSLFALLMLIAVALLLGFGVAGPATRHPQHPLPKRLQVVSSEYAEGRRMFVLKDTHTGKSYLCVAGCGVIETSSNP